MTKENPDVEGYHPRIIARFQKGNRESFIEIESAMHELNKYVSSLTTCRLLFLGLHMGK